MELKLAALYMALLSTTAVSAHRKSITLGDLAYKLIVPGTCERTWFGTAPFCAGSCPDEGGWAEVYHNNNIAYNCLAPGERASDITISNPCGYGKGCIFGGKSLCERNCHED